MLISYGINVHIKEAANCHCHDALPVKLVISIVYIAE